MEIKWLRPGVVRSKERSVILDPRGLQPPEEVRTAYWHGVPKKRGILLAALGRDDSYSFCYLWVPSSEDEADDSLMPDGLKLTALNEPLETTVATGLRLRWLSRRSRWVPVEAFLGLGDLPSDHQKIVV